ncbi:MAG: bifunctional YncE family protein/alkaline phosphatase family protein [Bacteroidetes bacterium]|nr:bifunctional YncE family protein/alkaline phosphatase family protein [Bacteroidota bacterium]
MKPFLFCVLMIIQSVVLAQVPGPIMLPNGWKLTPAGKSTGLGDLPLNLAISPDKQYIVATNNGYGAHTLQLLDAQTKTLLDTRDIGKAWYGLAFSADSKTIYASGGYNNQVVKVQIREKRLSVVDSIPLGKPWPDKIGVAGLALDDKTHRLFAVTHDDGALYVLDTETKKILSRTQLEGEAYTCLLSKDHKTLYISCWGCDKILLYDIGSGQIRKSIQVGDNPNEMVLSSNGKYLYAAVANDNAVAVLDARSGKLLEVLNAALYPGSPSGSTSNGVALSEDNKSLFVANADNNCVAVFDVSRPGASKGKGFIPVGWYPTSVRVLGNELLVANGKGFSSFPNPHGPNPTVRRQRVQHQANTTEMEVQYIGGMLLGTLSTILIPDAAQLAEYSKAVYANTPYRKETELTSPTGQSPIPSKVGDSSPIKYVFYIVKENRTYDQVLGDIPDGNGDPSLVLFGKDVTPNQHALAQQFVLFDNFYVNGEVSADGHNWSLGAYADDYLEKTWPTSYGGKGGNYSAEGNRKIANNKNGFIWDYAQRAGVSYRTYGEFADNGKANLPVLEGHFCKKYTSWDESVMDTTRFHQWRRDFDSLKAIHQIPRLNTLRFINDHTEGLRLGKHSPKAHVADNDYAVGLFIEYLSKSSIWNETVVFIVEDDAQNGPDHVDAHRSTLYVAGGMVKRKYVDHTMYSTASVLRTIELILGLPPMSQYDASAEPIWRSFNNQPDATPFVSIPARVDLTERNVAMNIWQRKSEKFDFHKEDRAPDEEFNQVLWYAVYGNTNFPVPRRAAFVNAREEGDDDD